MSGLFSLYVGVFFLLVSLGWGDTWYVGHYLLYYISPG
jgi:hypothetical protein